jgi:hypothetical protein
MSMSARWRLRLGCFGPWHHPFSPYGGSGMWGSPWWVPRVSRDEEKEALANCIAALKEELQDAEEHLRELAGC